LRTSISGMVNMEDKEASLPFGEVGE